MSRRPVGNWTCAPCQQPGHDPADCQRAITYEHEALRDARGAVTTSQTWACVCPWCNAEPEKP